MYGLFKSKMPKIWFGIWFGFAFMVSLIVFLNIYTSDVFFRLDLTEENKYSISESSINILSKLSEKVYIEVYLDGDLSTPFRRLQQSIKDYLEAFRAYSNKHLEYRFIDPNAFKNPKNRQRFIKDLMAYGIQPTSVLDIKDGKRTQKIVFPAAIITHKKRSFPVLLLKGEGTQSQEQQLRQSIENIEYELMSTIQLLTQTKAKRLAIVQGHGEKDSTQIRTFLSYLRQKYIVDFVDLKQQKALRNQDAVLVISPSSAYSDDEKFMLDQYIMQGGRAVFLIEKHKIYTDSITINGAYTLNNPHGLEDMLFKYGVRIGRNLLLDRQAGVLQVYTGMFGNKPNVQAVPWPYYAYINKFAKHPATKALDVLLCRYFSSVDTVQALGIKKTALAFTSRYTFERATPAVVSLNELKEHDPQKFFNKRSIPIAYLLEGRFSSLYDIPFLPTQYRNAIKKSKNTKVVVIGDGDLVEDKIFFADKKQLVPFDIDGYRKQVLSNKDFMMNLLAYLMDDKGIILTRNKQISLRPLDMPRIRKERTYIQVSNIAIPILIVVFLGLIRFYWRKFRYER